MTSGIIGLILGACLGFLLAGVFRGTDEDEHLYDALPHSLADLEAQRLAQQNED